MTSMSTRSHDRYQDHRPDADACLHHHSRGVNIARGINVSIQEHVTIVDEKITSAMTSSGQGRDRGEGKQSDDIPKKNNSRKTKMPPSYVPHANTVICGRGKSCLRHPGNVLLRRFIQEHLKSYSDAGNDKTAKTKIVTGIMRQVRDACPADGPAFVKKGDDDDDYGDDDNNKNNNNTWWEVDDAFAREKIGSIFRDALFAQYRSSTKSKLARKKMKRAAVAATVRSNSGGVNPTMKDNCVVPSDVTRISSRNSSLSLSSSSSRSSSDRCYDRGVAHSASTIQCHESSNMTRMMMMMNNPSWQMMAHGNVAARRSSDCGWGVSGHNAVASDYDSLLNRYLDQQQQPPHQFPQRRQLECGVGPSIVYPVRDSTNNCKGSNFNGSMTMRSSQSWHLNNSNNSVDVNRKALASNSGRKSDVSPLQVPVDEGNLDYFDDEDDVVSLPDHLEGIFD